jgi:calcineurin-like phosphoesterase family protein
MARFITADWHLGEDRLQIIGRPQASGEEMIEELVAKHNALVKPDDEVFVVGDVCYQKKPECVELVARFNGIKTLIRGNHDRDIPDEVFSRYFEQILPDGAGVQLDIETFLPTLHTILHKEWQLALTWWGIFIRLGNTN